MSISSLFAVEGHGVPDGLRPDLSDVALPSPDAKDILKIREMGFTRVGIVAAVIDEQDRILMLQHRGSEKSPDGALGPLAETAQAGRGINGSLQVESTAHTLSRGIHEELGVPPSSLQLRAKSVGAWVLARWPVGKNSSAEALAVCPVVRVTGTDAQKILTGFTGTDEISDVAFMTPEEIRGHDNLRPGVRDWLEGVVESDLAPPYDEMQPIHLPFPAPLIGAVDINLASIVV
jgi:hypothetical protein